MMFEASVALALAALTVALLVISPKARAVLAATIRRSRRP